MRRFIALERFASDESCFKYNICDAMPSICYDDDSANEKNHRGNRRNCIDAAPFSLWFVTFFSFFFVSRTHRHRRSYRLIVIVVPGVSTKFAVYPSRETLSVVAVILKATVHEPWSTLDIFQLFGFLSLHLPAVQYKDEFFFASLYDGLRKRQ